MAKIIKQYNTENVSGLKIYQFGIQATPGTTVYFNGDITNGVVIGSSGIFQAELTDGSYITSIQVVKQSGDTNPYYIDVIAEG